MKRIVSIIDPFDFIEQVLLFDDSQLIMRIEVPMKDLSDRILQLCYTEGHDILELTLRGDSNFTKKIREEIATKELTQYGKNNLRITLA